MLAPWCERESAEQAVVDLGVEALNWWGLHVSNFQQSGSLVLSMQRDKRDIERFARLTGQHQWLDSSEIGALEPDLAERFERGLFYSQEAYLDPRQAMHQLAAYLLERGVDIQFGRDVQAEDCDTDRVIDCRGFSAKDQLPGLRGVKGEMLVLQTAEIKLNRPVRLVHPRYPIYIVPREDNLFMLGATMIENEHRGSVTARSMLELLSAAYALHPAFAEAEIVESGVDLRPAYADNLPRLYRKDNVIFVNGLFRHGFLLSPAMAQQAADATLDEQIFSELKVCASS
jgi:glycine oxidase